MPSSRIVVPMSSVSATKDRPQLTLDVFITSVFVITGFALPIVLAHSDIIDSRACAMSIAGGGLVYGTIMAYAAAFNQEESDYE